MLRVISLGAGVQSTTLALMAALGELTPMPDCAIFADTQSEPAAVYSHLDWLERQLPFPVHRVTVGSLREQILSSARGEMRMDSRPPFFVTGGGMVNRQCTQDFKILPITKKVRELIGLAKGRRGPKTPAVEQWIGISLDEALRMKPSRLSYIAHRWPLIELRMTRRECIAWNEARGFPRPPKSACTFCPYHDNAQWRAMRTGDPESFADAVAVDTAIRTIPGQRAAWFVHRSLVPLDKVDLRTDAEAGQPDLFNNECEGMCGV